MTITCPVCDGDAALLGILGHVIHLRCLQCGWTFSIERERDE